MKKQSPELWKEITGPEHLFALQQAVELFDDFQRQVSACDKQNAAYLKTLGSKADLKTNPLAEPRAKKKNSAE